MAAKSSLRNMVLCLGGVCLVCSALLAGVNAVTEQPIRDAQTAKTNSTIAKVLPAFEGNAEESSVSVEGVEYVYYRTPGGFAVVSGTNGFGGSLILMVGITSDGLVYNTSVLSHSETPGLGAKCTSDTGFIGQFKGLDPAEKKLSVKKDGGDIDAITASTITSRAYTLAVGNAVKVFKAITGGQNNEQ